MDVNCVFTNPYGTYVLKSEIKKDQSVCDQYDYDCIYSQTTYQFSDNQLACYTPKIPERDRKRIFFDPKDTKVVKTPYYLGEFNLSIEAADGSRIVCINASDCKVYYSYTSEIRAIDQSHFYIGSQLTFRGTPKDSKTPEIMSIKIGRYNCVPIISDVMALYGYGDALINCDLGTTNIYPEYVDRFMFMFMNGQATYNSLFTKYKIDTTLRATRVPYFFKIFPKIDFISSTSGFRKGGQSLTITGKGFGVSLADSNAKVYINNDLCTITYLAYDTITCTSPISSINFATPPSYYIGSQGLRWRMYNANSITAMTALANFPNTSPSSIFKDDVILETSTPSIIRNNYAQYFNGYFKAMYTGKYRFWSTSDDPNQVWLSTDSTAANKVKVLDFNSFTAYNDFITQSSKSKSDWVNLVKDNYYYVEMMHSQGTGLEHYRLGVEIDSSSSINNAIPPFANQINKIQNVTITPVIVRDLFEFRFPDLSSSTYTLTCKTADGTLTKSASVYSSMKASDMYNSLKSVANAETRFIIRKVAYNEVGLYYLGAAETLDTYSFTSAYSFDDMNIVNNGAITTFSTVSTGTKTGNAFLIFVDRKKSDTTYQIDSQCYIAQASATKKLFTKLQTAAVDLAGTISFKITDPELNQVFVTDDIDVTSFYSGMDIALWPQNKIPFLANRAYMYNVVTNLDQVLFYLWMKVDSDIKLEVNAKSLTGGFDNNPVVVISNLLDKNNNLFFYPIPADFLYTQSKINII